MAFTNGRRFLPVLQTADKMGDIAINLPCGSPTVGLDPILHLVMTVARSEVSGECNGESFERVLHFGGLLRSTSEARVVVEGR